MLEDESVADILNLASRLYRIGWLSDQELRAIEYRADAVLRSQGYRQEDIDKILGTWKELAYLWRRVIESHG